MNKIAYVGFYVSLAWLSLIVFFGVLGPVLWPLESHVPDSSPLLGAPGMEHWLGTDEEGRDVLRLLISGAQTALFVGLATVLICGVVGTTVGITAGFLGGWFDRMILTLMEAVYAFPGILLAIFLMFLMPNPGAGHIIIALSISGWATYARLARGIALQAKGQTYIEAARCVGLKRRSIMVHYILPHTLPHIAIQASFGFANAILAEATLSFLGLGIPDGTSWGAMLSSGAVLHLKAPHLAIAPGIVLALTILVILMMSDRLQEKLNPLLQRGLSNDIAKT
jgi:ABC-type dipeptide/oligopeptide/nickel transport system permease subunit